MIAKSVSSADHSIACPMCGAYEGMSRYVLHDARLRIEYVVFQCGRCHHSFNATLCGLPPGESSRLYDRSYYTEHQKTYFKIVERRDSFTTDSKFPLYRKALDDIERSGTFGHLLDVGCAMGFFVNYARQRGWFAEGIDVSPYAVQRAKELYGLEIRQGTLEDCHVPDRSMDLVTLWDVLEHVARPRALLQEIWRILRPGGHLVFLTDSEKSSLLSLSTLIFRVCGWTYPLSRLHPYFNYSYFDPDALVRDVQAIGFEVQEVRGYDQPVDKTETNPLEAFSLPLLLWMGKLLARQTQIYVHVRRPKRA